MKKEREIKSKSFGGSQKNYYSSSSFISEELSEEVETDKSEIRMTHDMHAYLCM